jgi:hypothetical protein
MSNHHRSLYFFLTLWISVVVLCAIAGGVIYTVFHATSKDFDTYQALMAEANPVLANKTQKVLYKTSQQQKQVRKDLLSLKGNDRLHFVLSSNDIHLVLDQQQGKTQLTEELLDISCYAQYAFFHVDHNGRPVSKKDPLAQPWQKTLLGKAKSAFYCYQDKTFSADDIHIFGYEMPGTQLSIDILENTSLQHLLHMQAEKAIYDGTTFSLLKNFHLEHPQGSISAEKVEAYVQFNSKEEPLKSIAFEQDVIFILKEKGSLCCQKATIDLKSLKGHFYGSPAIYRSPTSIEQNQSPISLKGQFIEATLKHDPEKSGRYTIESLSAIGNVSIETSQNLHVRSDKAIYHKDELTLKGATEVAYRAHDTLKNDREICLHCSEIQGKKQFNRITAEGHTVLHHLEPISQRAFWVVCDGTVNVDHVKKTITLDSVRDSLDNVCAGKQVLFYDPLGEVQADKATILYDSINGKLMLTKISLEGNVYLVDHQTIGETKEPLHYGIADFAEYAPESKEIYFSSLPGQRVLFDDKLNRLQVSAPALRITRDATSKKESIKGIGDVRFHFLESELEKLHKHTPMPF